MNYNNEITLNTVNAEMVYKSLARILNSDVSDLKKIIMHHHDDFYSSDLWKKDLKVYFSECVSIDKLCFTHVVINHIAYCPDIERIKKEGLFPLHYVLTRSSTLSEHLKKFEIEFEYSSDQSIIIMRKDGLNYIPQQSNYHRLINRLKGKNAAKDLGLCGFLWTDKYALERIKNYLGSPEILKDIASEFDEKEIVDSYCNKGDNYLLSLKIPIDMVNFGTEDDNNRKNKFEKTNALIKYSLTYLAAKYINDVYFSFDKHVLMVDNDYCVPPKDIIKVRKLIIQNIFNVYPEEI